MNQEEARWGSDRSFRSEFALSAVGGDDGLAPGWAAVGNARTFHDRRHDPRLDARDAISPSDSPGHFERSPASLEAVFTLSCRCDLPLPCRSEVLP
jgi:hypothetical protein